MLQTMYTDHTLLPFKLLLFVLLQRRDMHPSLRRLGSVRQVTIHSEGKHTRMH